MLRWFLCNSFAFYGALFAFSSGHAAELTTVLDEENLPYSSEKGAAPGLNTEIARALAEKMGRPLKIVWENTLNEGVVSPLLRHEDPIHLAVGVPVEPLMVEDEQRVGDKVLYSKPFASTRYVLVTRKSHKPVRYFEDVGTAKVGVEMSSVASGVLWSYGFHLEYLESQDRILRAMADHELDYGILWSNAGWLIDNNDAFRDALRIHTAETTVPGLAWNLAVAIGPANAALLPHVNEAIDKLKDEGAFKRLFAKYATPYFEPFAEEGNTSP